MCAVPLRATYSSHVLRYPMTAPKVALVGKPDDATIERMATQRGNRQNKSFLLRMDPPANPPNLAKLFPPAKDQHETTLWAAGLDLIQKMLVFDPAQ